MSTPPETTKVSLRAQFGDPLNNDETRGIVVSTAHAIAERIGVPVVAITTDPNALHAQLVCDRVAAIGFAAELRRLTEQWYRSKYEITLWGETPLDEDTTYTDATDLDPW
jgi:hypothetical protein